jgi:hypothetical protein
MSTVTMQELELETAELLPARETLWSSCRCSHAGSSSTTNIDSGNGNFDGNGNSNFGLLNILSGDNGNLDGNTIIL